MVYVHYMRKDQLASDEDAEKVYGDEPSQLPESTQLA
jgi:hypothetical protein